MTSTMSDATIAETSRALAESPPPPPPPGSPLTVKFTLTPGSPLKLSPPHNRLGVSGVGENTTISKDTSTVASSTSSFSHEDSSNNNNNNNASALLSPPLLLEIEDGTPAAEALKANADVRVSKLRKVGRSVRVLKSASRTSRGGSGAHVRSRSLASIDQTQPAILEVDDEGGSDHDHGADADNTLERHESDGDENNVSSSLDNALDKSTQINDADADRDKQLNPTLGTPSASTDGVIQSNNTPGTPAAESGLLTQHSALNRSGQKSPSVTIAEANRKSDGNLDDLRTEKDKLPHTPPSAPIESLLLAPNHPSHRLSGSFTHLASSAAVAAACLAGEEMDRKRAAQIIELGIIEGAEDTTANLAGHAHKSPLKQPFTHLFKGNANMSEMGSIDDSAIQTRRSPRPGILRKRACSVSDGIAHVPLLPRGASTGSAPAITLSKLPFETTPEMPSEISIDETVKHDNVRLNEKGDAQQLLDDLSDDGIVLFAGKHSDDTELAQPERQISFSPILVEIPGSSTRQFTIEESKEEEDEEVQEMSEIEREADHHKPLMTKARKKLSRMAIKKKEVIPDDDSFYFHGPKSVRKWVKRRRSKVESKDLRSYVKGKVIDGKHELYTMSIAVMFGMRTSIGRTNLAMSQTAHNSRRWLDNDDLMAVEKYEFPPRGSDITPPHLLNHTFKFKDYSPLAFAYLRRMFGVNEYDFLLSVCGNANYIEFQSNAKSEQFFFYSPDGKYMIKTMTNTESKFLRRILPHYFRHCAMNPNTLVTKFLGMYRVKLYHLNRNVKFVVMKSVYDTDKFLHQLFDVKGSTTGRDAKPSDAVKKDNDIRRMLPDGAFVLEPGLRERLKAQVENDCQWLQSMKIMDYSMLIGVHNICQRSTKPTLKPVVTPTRTTPNDDGDNGSYSSNDASNATLDRFLDDDDDSYLDGVHNKSSRTLVGSGTSHTSGDAVRVLNSSEKVDDESFKESRKGMDALVEKAIEDMYWPFHRFYNIQGLRRMTPVHESPMDPETEEGGEPQLTDEMQGFWKAWFDPKSQTTMSSGGNSVLPTFEAPLSFRKDGGLMMDTTSIEMPLEIPVSGAPYMVEYCDGKIFYMGIIDILQQFNIRKRCEARYRRLAGKGWEAASCVHPKLYAHRFIRFFDEYTAYHQPSNEQQSVSIEPLQNNTGKPHQE